VIVRLLRTNFLGALSDEEQEAQRVIAVNTALPGDPTRTTNVLASASPERRLLRTVFNRFAA
jgi:hypothetical protein